jgi:hypothetical protein
MGHVLGADADQTKLEAAAPELGEGVERVGTRLQRPLRPLTPHCEDLLDVRLCPEPNEKFPQVVGDRPDLATLPSGDPGLAEALFLDPGGLGHPVVEEVCSHHVPPDQGLPEIEDDRAVTHFLSSFLTEPQGRVFRI